jgi:hypothetical protein
VQPEPSQIPRPHEAPGGWDSLAFGAAEPPPARRRRLVAVLVGAGLLVVGGLGVGQFLPARSGPEPRVLTLTPHPAPPSTYLSMDGSTRPLLTGRPPPAPGLTPTGLGTDPTFNLLARECYRGSMHVCDELYAVSMPGSRYESFADSCAGRQEAGGNVYCTTAFPGS